jgi:hypothetical protein
VVRGANTKARLKRFESVGCIESLSKSLQWILRALSGSGRIRLVRKTFELQDPLALEQLCRLAPDRQQREEMFTIAYTA